MSFDRLAVPLRIMAVVLSARAGTSLNVTVRWWEPGKTQLIDSDLYTAHLEIGRQTPKRTYLDAREWRVPVPDEDDEDGIVDVTPPPGTVLVRVQPGIWEIRLGKTVTRSLPSESRFELELVNNNDPEDVIGLLSGEIRSSPEAVIGVANTSRT